jgi:hypothetical protein
MRIRQSRSDSRENSIIIFRIELVPAGSARAGAARTASRTGWLVRRSCFRFKPTTSMPVLVEPWTRTPPGRVTVLWRTTNPQRFRRRVGPHSGIRPVLDRWQCDSESETTRMARRIVQNIQVMHHIHQALGLGTGLPGFKLPSLRVCLTVTGNVTRTVTGSSQP